MTDLSTLQKIANIKSDENWRLESANLRLEAFKEHILTAEFVEGLNDESVLQYLELRHNPPSYQDQIDFIEADMVDPSSVYLALVDKTNNRLIGSVRISEVSEFNRRCTIGIAIVDKSSWGKGYASEAIRETTNFAHDELGLRRVSAGCYGGNVASKQAFLKAGYELEGELKSYWSTGTQQHPGVTASQILLGSVREV